MKDSPITPRPGKAPGAERPSRMSVVIAVVMSCVAAVLAWAFISAVVRTEAGGDVVTILGASITLASLVWPDVRKSRNKKYEAQKQDISVLSRALTITGTLLTFAGVVVGNKYAAEDLAKVVSFGVFLAFLLAVALLVLNALRERKLKKTDPA